MCGGPPKEVKDAANSQRDLTDTAAANYKAGTAITTPFYSKQVQEGLPYFNAESQYATSNLAHQANIAKTQMKAKRAGYGNALPSGFAEGADRAFDADVAHAFDRNQSDLLQQQQAAKERAAAGLNPNAQASLAMGGNSSISQMPLQNNFWGNLVGGIVQGGSRVASAYAGGA